MRAIEELVVHCSATPAGKPFRAADIDRWHREQGWNGIGYHYVITLDGSIEPGRDLEEAGAHVAGHNRNSIGICYIGGMNAQNTAPADPAAPAATTSPDATQTAAIDRSTNRPVATSSAAMASPMAMAPEG